MVNNAIDEIGFTKYHIKLFCLNGFGYATDSLLLLLQSIVADDVGNEFHPSFARGLTIAAYVGMLVGALFWGLSADIIGRKFAFNFSLLISSIFAISAGASPNWVSLGTFVALSSFGAGGNLVLDTTVFLEYLPSKQQWLLTLMAAWWGIGQLVAGLLAWAFLPNYSCGDTVVPCTKSENMGWRYVWYTGGALVFVMSIARLTVIRLKETPKYLIGEGKDQEVVETLQSIATKYNRPCSLTLERLESCGVTAAPNERRGSVAAHAKRRASPAEVLTHLRGLFETRKIGLSTCLIWFSWTLIGLAYPLYNVFLPQYLKSRGAQFGQDSASITWRNYTLVSAFAIVAVSDILTRYQANFASIFGPVLAGYMCASKYFWGRRGTVNTARRSANYTY